MKKHKAWVPGKYAQHTSINTNKASCITQPTSPAATKTFRWAMIVLGTNSELEVRQSSEIYFLLRYDSPKVLTNLHHCPEQCFFAEKKRGVMWPLLHLANMCHMDRRFRRSVLGGIEGDAMND